MGISLIHLHLDAPLQSWGIRSKWWYHRDTIYEPTKSGVVGLLSGALGLERNDPGIETLNKELIMGVRVEREPELKKDFQTISGGYQTANHSFITDSIVLSKDYLQGAFFLVILSGPIKLLKHIQKALKNPKFVSFLGRKCCLPASKILAGTSRHYKSIKEALYFIPWSLEWRLKFPHYFIIKEIPLKLRCVIEDKEGNITQNDVRLINNAKIRRFAFRNVSEFYVPTPLVNERILEDFNVSL